MTIAASINITPCIQPACGTGKFSDQTKDGRAERTGLHGQSVDFVTAAQAFHWFEAVPTRQEFKRILRPGGKVVFLWNDKREKTLDAFTAAAQYKIVCGNGQPEPSTVEDSVTITVIETMVEQYHLPSQVMSFAIAGAHVASSPKKDARYFLCLLCGDRIVI